MRPRGQGSGPSVIPGATKGSRVTSSLYFLLTTACVALGSSQIAIRPCRPHRALHASEPTLNSGALQRIGTSGEVQHDSAIGTVQSG